MMEDSISPELRETCALGGRQDDAKKVMMPAMPSLGPKLIFRGKKNTESSRAAVHTPSCHFLYEQTHAVAMQALQAKPCRTFMPSVIVLPCS